MTSLPRLRRPSPSLSLNLLLLLLAFTPCVRAQVAPPEDFFHSGALFYLSNNIPSAKEAVKMGRQYYPADEKLKKLEQLLNQAQQQQQQKQKQDQSKSDSKDQQSPPDKSGQSGQQKGQPKDQPSKPDQQSDPAQSAADQAKDKVKDKDKAAQKPEDQKPTGDKAAQTGDDQDKDEQPDAKGAHAMTPKEAEQLLNNQKGNEQFLALKPKGKPPDSRRPLKDW